ncbi:MAG: fatty acid desaturase [Deltaproteobacteria bacterium]|nr:fatty acid desaturase [Deltaproteobacteria bacterium]MDW8247360.1 fatty acid desaturase [Sandaracinaceae bacterium]
MSAPAVNPLAVTKRRPGFWTSLPFSQFKRDPYFYVKYDTAYFVFAVSGIALLHAFGYRPPEWQPWMHLLLIPAIYLMIMAHVFAHNASHGNFPKAINRLVGEIVGAIVLTKFASWEIVHRRHHRYSDDPERDPHPAEPSFWRYVINSIVKVERQLQRQYFEIHGDTPARRRYERFRSFWSFFTGATLAFLWYTLMGPGLFFFVYLPAFLFAALFVIHFNWSGHNAHVPGGKIQPVNLDSGWFWLGNRLFFGIYYHANHHKMARAFNPMKIQIRSSVMAEGEED